MAEKQLAIKMRRPEPTGNPGPRLAEQPWGRDAG
jgi:hypothetical protein